MGATSSYLADQSSSTLARVPAPSPSVVRLRVPVADDATRALLRDFGARQVALTDGLAWTYARLSLLPRDPSTRAAGLTLSARIADIGDVRDALNELYRAIARKGATNLIAPGAPLSLYLDGVYHWVQGALEALATLGAELLDLQADWASYRMMLDVAKSYYASPLAPAVRTTLWAMTDEDARTDLTAAFDELSFALRLLETNLDQRFG